MKTKKEISSLIEQYLSHDIDPDEERQLLQLISENKWIKEELLLRQKIDKAIRKKEVMELRQQLKSLSRRRNDDQLFEEAQSVYKISWLKAAAIIIVLLGLGFMLARHLGNRVSVIDKRENTQISAVKKDILNVDQGTSDYGGKTSNTITQIQENNPLPEKLDPEEHNKNEALALSGSFIESEYFESFIVNYRSHEVKILGPKPSESFELGSAIQFSWNNSLGDSLMLRIFNNKEDLIFQSTTFSDYLCKLKFHPGLYYWKLESEDDLIYMNKFSIR